MAVRLRPILSLAMPLLALGGLGLLFLRSPGTAPAPERASNGPGTAGLQKDETWIPTDLAAADSLETIPGWDVRRGSWRLDTVDGRRVLALFPEPIVEGKILYARAMRGGAGVRARMRGDRSRRTFPRFSLGLHQGRELHLRAYPEKGRLELVSCDPDLSNVAELASAEAPDGTWKPENWIWLEFRIAPSVEAGKQRCEGRWWVDGKPRPEAAQLVKDLVMPEGIFHAALQGAAYALRPLIIDRVEIPQSRPQN